MSKHTNPWNRLVDNDPSYKNVPDYKPRRGDALSLCTSRHFTYIKLKDCWVAFNPYKKKYVFVSDKTLSNYLSITGIKIKILWSASEKTMSLMCN